MTADCDLAGCRTGSAGVTSHVGDRTLGFGLDTKSNVNWTQGVAAGLSGGQLFFGVLAMVGC